MSKRRLDQILQDVADRQIHLYLEEDKLKFRAPKNALDSSLAGEIKQYKPQIIQMLSAASELAHSDDDQDQKPVVSYAQERLWFLQKLEQQPTAYNIQALFHLEGDLDTGLLQDCFRMIMKRHEVLRTRFIESDGEVIPVIEADPPLDFKIIYKEPPEFNTDFIYKYAREEMNTSFDLEKLPLLRSRLIYDGNQSYYLILTIHHIITDGWSHSIFFKELTTLYEQKRQKQSTELPPLPAQYVDYARTQRRQFENENQNEGLRTLVEHLGKAPHFLDLPTDFRRPNKQSFKGKLLSRELPAPLASEFKKLCRENGSTLYSGLLTIFQCWLHRLSGRKSLLTGTPVSGRTSSEVENLIGFFVNTLVVRTDIEPDTPFNELLSSISERIPELIQYQDVPFEKVVEEIQPLRNLEYNPLFQVFFNMLSHDEAKIELSGITIQQLPLPETSTPFDLTLYAIESDDKLKLELLYSMDLFSEERAEIMLSQIISMIRQAVENPAISISEFSLASIGNPSADKDQNGDYDPETVEHLTDRIIKINSSKTSEPALIHDNKTISYQKFRKLIESLSRNIKKYESNGIAILSGRTETIPIGLITALLTGTPFIIIDETYPDPRICDLLQKSGVDTLITAENSKHSDFLTEFIGENKVRWLTIDSDTLQVEDQTKFTFTPAEPDALTYWAATSGTTNESKLIAGSRAPLDHFVNWYLAECDVEPGDRFTMLSGLSHDPLLRDILIPMATGGTLCIPGSEEKNYPAKMIQWIDKSKIHFIHITPALMQILVDASNPDQTIESVKQIILGGDLLKSDLLAKINLLFPNARLLNGYGSTETPQLISCSELNHFITDKEVNFLPVGNGINGSKLIIKNRFKALCGVGEPGEVCVESEHLSLGYWKNGFISDDHFEKTDSGSMIYPTGDKGRYLPNGSVTIEGRLDRQLNIHGYRIDPAEVEECLNRHNFVKKAVVWAHDGRLLGAFITDGSANQSQNKLSESLNESLKKVLPSYMVPDRIFTVPRFPLNRNGKIDFNKLTELDLRESEQTAEYIEARDLTEKKLTGIWQELLKRQKISIDDDFFRLGGHSLLAAKLNNRIRKEFSIELSLRDHFTYTTIRSLSARIKSGHKRSSLQIHPAVPKSFYPLSHAQRRLWVLSKIDETSVVYNMPRALKITGDLDPEKVDSFLRNLVDEHSILRTIFREMDDEPVQMIRDEMSGFYEYRDLTSHPKPMAEAASITDSESQKPFDLEIGPLFRALLLKVGSRKHILFFNIHHIISDGWSMELIEKEFMSAVGPVRENGHHKVGRNRSKKKGLQYSDYTEWQSEFLSTDFAFDLRSYWHQLFKEKPQLLDLPSDFSRPQVKTYSGRRVTCKFEPDLIQKFNSITKQSGCSDYMVLNTLISTLLYRYSGCQDFVVGTPSAGRVTEELEDRIGCFVNMLPLRVKPQSDKSFFDFLNEVKNTTIDAFSNESYPYDKLIDELDLERRPDRTPLFDVAIVFQNPDKMKLHIPGFQIEPFNRVDGVAKYDLTFTFEKDSDAFYLEIEYNSDLYREERIDAMIDHIKTLIHSVENNLSGVLSGLSILSDQQIAQIRAASIPEKPDWPEDKTIDQIFREQAFLRADQCAIESESDRITYQELNIFSDLIANYLISNGCQKGDFVTLDAERSVAGIAAILGILKAGAVYVPVDPEHPEERKKFIRDDCSAQFHLNSEQIQTIHSDQSGDTCITLPKHTNPEDPAYVIYTSGSTGRPKGCIVKHENVVQLLFNENRRFDFSEKDTWITTHSFCFDFSVWEMYGSLLYGGKLIIASKEEVRNPELLHQLLQNHEVTVLNQTPAAFYNLIEADLQYSEPNLKALRIVIFGGDRLEPAYLKRWIHRYDLNRTKLINMYGITETTVHVTYHPLTENEIQEGDGSSPIGLPLPLTNLYVLDENRQFCPMGVPGELYVGGNGVSLGYHNRDELNSQKFLADPFEPGQIMYRSGDVGTLKFDQTFEYNGRNDHQIQLHGFRIETGEIESALNKHDLIQKSVVLLSGRDESSKKLIAYCVVNKSIADSLRHSDLREFLKDRIPDYMVPAHFVMIDVFPLTSNGKIDRNKLLSMDSKPIEPFIGSRSNPEAGIGDDVILSWITQIWEQLLGIDNPNPDTNFFDLGGNSITLMKLNSELRKKMKNPLPVVDLFRYTTIRSLCDQIKKQDPGLEEQLSQTEQIL